MKRTVINLGAILVAFIIGLAINNACADSLDNMTDTELRKLVSQLQQEVNSLKSRVAELEGKIGSGSGSGSSIGGAYAFEVDGVHYSMSGAYCDPLDYYEMVESYQIVNGNRTDATPSVYKISYTYDSYGRIASMTQDMSTYTNVSQYTYSNKSVTINSKQTYKDPAASGQSEYGYKIVYHLK